MVILYLTLVFLELVHKQLELSVPYLGRYCTLESERRRCQ